MPVQSDYIKRNATVSSTFDEKFTIKDIEIAIKSLQKKYDTQEFALEILEISEGYQFFTKPSFHPIITTLVKQTNKRKLSRAAIETLSTLAYKQPVTKAEMEKIRGVSCDYSIQKLLEKELIEIQGRSEDAGRPLIYGTSPKFMKHFGLKSMKDLPKLKEFKSEDNSIGPQESNEIV